MVFNVKIQARRMA